MCVCVFVFVLGKYKVLFFPVFRLTVWLKIEAI